ncbi:methylated-DNA--[protein]-cysteine S-methyltransferase [Sedimentibacter sp. zth1]|uniref:methylated-DNA--[protein]-cysteine S-methyltransferase n=1 Tax=Sedimentibacter sp. zth1 TaxID=2816908 RepID=UPI001A925E83|nr:methylated-DNA--[protein]-cysteine S-methyltransferase [Sedimentibacter sp. zth1]QSX06218.1 methylated-DNA--[protein]-cysteine S-methyltransferase [Sedimentibacter sp. zth1]
MATVYYEYILIKKYKIFLAYTKDFVIQAKFFANDSSIINYNCFLKRYYTKVVHNRFRSDYGLILENFLLGKCQNIDLPIKFLGTDTNKNVWSKIMDIPFGKLITYDDLVSQLGDSITNKLVIQAINKNNFDIIVPCHRVINKNKTISVGAGICSEKIELLKLEGHIISKKGNNFCKKSLYIVEK